MMNARTEPLGTPACTRTITRVPATIILMGLFLGALTGTALWALRPEVCSEFCSVHAFLVATLGLAVVLYFAFGRQDGLPAAVCFALSFGAGVMVVALAVSAARISAGGDDVMLEPIARAVVAGLSQLV